MPTRRRAIRAADLRPPTAAQKRRLFWGKNLADQLDSHGKMSVKQFQRELLGAGVDVSNQAIYSWLKGDTAPRPEHQVVIAQVLNTRAHLIFPVAAA